jgi:hypothetical protein
MYAASPPEELCVRCLTGHDSDWFEYPEPDWWVGRWMMQRRFVRWLLSAGNSDVRKRA